MERRKYKSNLVYVMEIHGCQYYIGCHCSKKKDSFSEYDILSDSGNPLMVAYRRKVITRQEYRDCCKVIYVEDFDTPSEALNRESELIKKFKEHYGNQCLNKSDGNLFGGGKGLTPTDESKKKSSDSNRNNPKQDCHPVRQYTKDGQFVAEYPSLAEAERQTGIRCDSISRAAQEKQCPTHGRLYTCRSAGNYLWKLA